MKKINPDTDRFRLIQLWLHIHCAIGYCIKRHIMSDKSADHQKTVDHIKEILEYSFPNEMLWFGGDELLQVWAYECSHRESYNNCENYLKKQGIRRAFP